MQHMQRLIGLMRKAIQEYDMLKDGDRVAVGVSGGKDSVALLYGLSLLRRFIGIDFSIIGITLDPGFNGKWTDYSKIEELCKKNNIEYIVKRTHIGDVVFNVIKEEHPCSLCARMRRGALHDAAKEANCNVVALGHHYDDAVETFVMNLFNEGRIGCYAPKSYLSRKDLLLIRPLSFATEKEVISAVKQDNLPIVKSVCPVDGYTNRQKTKDFLEEREKIDPGFKYRLFGAMRRANVDDWGGKTFANYSKRED